MPQGTNPPRAPMPSAVRSFVQSGSSSYNSFAKGFNNGGTTYFLGYERQSGQPTCGQVFYGTATDIAANNNPQCLITNATWDVIHSGTYNSNSDTWDYNGNEYELLIEEVSGDIYATAVTV